jgi:hypothetical protein
MDKSKTRTQRVISALFMLFILILAIIQTYFSFQLSSSLDQLTDKTTNPSVKQNYNALVSWNVALIAICILILVVALVGIIFTPYVIVGFLFLYLLVILALFIYSSIILSNLLSSVDYGTYSNGCKNSTISNCSKIVDNFQNGLTGVIVLMVTSVILVITIAIFLYFMIKSLSQAGGIEAETEYLISKFTSDDTNKLYTPAQFGETDVFAEKKAGKKGKKKKDKQSQPAQGEEQTEEAAEEGEEEEDEEQEQVQQVQQVQQRQGQESSQTPLRGKSRAVTFNIKGENITATPNPKGGFKITLTPKKTT